MALTSSDAVRAVSRRGRGALAFRKLWGFDVQELHALVVEDDPDISSALVETLEGAGFRVTSAPDGRQAVSAAAADPLPEVRFA